MRRRAGYARAPSNRPPAAQATKKTRSPSTADPAPALPGACCARDNRADGDRAARRRPSSRGSPRGARPRRRHRRRRGSGTNTALSLGSEVNSWPCSSCWSKPPRRMRSARRRWPPPADSDRRGERHREDRRQQAVAVRHAGGKQRLQDRDRARAARPRSRSSQPGRARDERERSSRAPPIGQRDPGPHREAAAGPRPGLDAAAVQRRALAHSDDPVTAGVEPSRSPARGRRRRPRAPARLGRQRTETSARAAPACLIVFVSASCTTR